MPFKSQVSLLSKDMACKVQKVKVKVQKGRKKTKKDKFKRQSNDTFPDVGVILFDTCSQTGSRIRYLRENGSLMIIPNSP